MVIKFSCVFGENKKGMLYYELPLGQIVTEGRQSTIIVFEVLKENTLK